MRRKLSDLYEVISASLASKAVAEDPVSDFVFRHRRAAHRFAGRGAWHRYLDSVETLSRASTRTHYDVVIATDLRFPGGTSASTLEEIRLNAQFGLTTGIIHMTGRHVGSKKKVINAGYVNAIRDGTADLVSPTREISAGLLLVRHPSVIPVDGSPLPRVSPERVVLVVNHPPVNARGRSDYVLTYCQRLLAKTYGTKIDVRPIGPVLRTSLEELGAKASVHLIQRGFSSVGTLSSTSTFSRGSRRSDAP